MNVAKWFCAGALAASGLAAFACGGAKSATAPTATLQSIAPSASSAPSAAATIAAAPLPGPPLVVSAMKVTAEKQKGSIRLEDDGTVIIDEKPAMKIVGADLQDLNGRSLILVTADGSLRFDGVAKGAKFNEKDEVVIDDGAKLFVDDDGVVRLTNPDGKVDKASGKVKLVGFKPAARRAASIFALAAFMMKPSDAQMSGTK